MNQAQRIKQAKKNNVPICPRCGQVMKKIDAAYVCPDCRNRIMVFEWFGNSEQLKGAEK
jgi:rubrerythrin